jgi:hypothetical protein
MSEATVASLLEGIFGPLFQCLDAESARRIAAFRIAPEVQSRVDVLAERANDGQLTDGERAEYEAFIMPISFPFLGSKHSVKWRPADASNGFRDAGRRPATRGKTV